MRRREKSQSESRALFPGLGVAYRASAPWIRQCSKAHNKPLTVVLLGAHVVAERVGARVLVGRAAQVPACIWVQGVEGARGHGRHANAALATNPALCAARSPCLTRSPRSAAMDSTDSSRRSVRPTCAMRPRRRVASASSISRAMLLERRQARRGAASCGWGRRGGRHAEGAWVGRPRRALVAHTHARFAHACPTLPSLTS